MEADQLHVAEGEEALEVLVTESCKAIAVRDVHSFDLTVRCVVQEFVQAFPVFVESGCFVLISVASQWIVLVL